MTTEGVATNADQIAFWNEAAGETWAALQERMDAQLDPLGRAAIAALAPRRGERLLDLGCGSGATTLQLAEAVGPDGEAVGVDISRPMLAVARARPAPQGGGRTSFVEADVQVDPLPSPAFDAACSRFGVMFFADPVAAFRNVRAALKPGGRLAFVCWRSQSENPMFTTPMGAALKHLTAPPPPPPLAPGPFAFADPSRVRSVLADAGWSAVDVAALDQPISPGTLDQTLNVALKIGPLGSMLREIPDQREVVSASVREALKAHLRDGRVVFESATWLVTARA